MEGQHPDGTFKTSSAQVYQPPMCELLAQAFMYGDLTKVPHAEPVISHAPLWLSKSKRETWHKERIVDLPLEGLGFQKLVANWNWRELFAISLTDPDHINVKELRGLRTYVRSRAKGGFRRPQRVLVLVDSKVALGAFV